MKRKLLFWLICLKLCVVSGWCYGQKTNILDSLLQARQWRSAQYEGLRQLCFAGSDSVRSSSCRNIGKALLAAGSPDSAALFLDMAWQFCPTRKCHNPILFERSLALLLAGRASEAISELQSIKPENQDQTNQKAIFLGLHYFLIYEYDQARLWLAKASLAPGYNFAQVDQLLGRAAKAERLRPIRASVLSAIVPGAGQLYAHKPGQALNSFLLNGTLAAITVYTGLQYNWLQAATAVLPWLQRYYLGGIKKAGLLTVRYQQEENRRILKKLIVMYPPDI